MFSSHHKSTVVVFFILCLMLITAGCTKRYVITQELEQPFKPGQTCSIGGIEDALPLDMDPEDKPSLEDIDKLKGFLMEEINKKDALSIYVDKPNTDFEINGAILDFKKGSGALRFFIGFGAGNAKMITNLQLVDKKDGRILFAGNFTSTVSDGLINGEEIFRVVAKDFTSQLNKQLEKHGVYVKKK